jgi:hypothetical protein
MFPSDETFFVEENPERNRRRYRILLEEQYRIAYISNGAIDFHAVGTLTTEDRQEVVDIIKQVKDEEKRELERARSKSPSSPPPTPKSLPLPKHSRFSSKGLSKPTGIPRFPKR